MRDRGIQIKLNLHNKFESSFHTQNDAVAVSKHIGSCTLLLLFYTVFGLKPNWSLLSTCTWLQNNTACSCWYSSHFLLNSVVLNQLILFLATPQTLIESQLMLLWIKFSDRNGTNLNCSFVWGTKYLLICKFCHVGKARHSSESHRRDWEGMTDWRCLSAMFVCFSLSRDW